MENNVDKFEIEDIYNTSFPVNVQEAVRYGYQYRKLSETCGDNLHFSLPDLSNVLYKLAEIIASGITFDCIKEISKRIYSLLQTKKKDVDKETEQILNNEDLLREFSIYIEEYYSRKMKITERQEKYIKEEVIADAFAEESGRIRKETNRIELSVEEYMRVMKSARAKADEIIKRV